MIHSAVTEIQSSDWLTFPGKPDIIELEPDHITKAQKFRDLVQILSKKWQSYLQGLAIQAFEAWIQQRQPDLQIDTTGCSILQPCFASVIDAVFNVRVGSFKVCLIPTAQFTVDEVSIPRAVLELPEYMAHFYVVVSMSEDLEFAGIQGFLRYDQLADCQSQLHLDRDWTYTLPITQFTLEPDELLLNLQCLAPAAIPLPVVSKTQPETLIQLHAKLPKLLNSGPEIPLWQVLSWEQGSNLLRYPELLELIYQGKTQEESSELWATDLQIRFHELVTLFTQVAINTADWLDGKLDEIAQNLSLYYGPNRELASAMRGPGDEKRFERAIAYLRDTQGLQIPLDINSVYQDQELGNLALRICSSAWANATDEQQTSWSLLLIVGTQTEEHLPAGTQLRLGDAKGTVHNPQLQFAEPFLYALIEGQQSEAFISTVVSKENEWLTLSPYKFDMGSAE